MGVDDGTRKDAHSLFPEQATEATFGKPIVFGPPGPVKEAGKHPPTAAVIWLHGFGDRPDGWAQLLRPLRAACPREFRWLHLRAPAVAQPCFKGKKLPGWGPFHSVDCVRVGKIDHEDPDDAGSYAATVLKVHSIIRELEQDGIPSERVVVGGFSQGAAVALESGLTYPNRLAGLVSLSGWLTPRARKALEFHRATPVLLGHGTADPMVHHECSEFAQKTLMEAYNKVTERQPLVRMELFKGMQHTSRPAELLMVANFLGEQLGLSGGEGEEPTKFKVPEWEAGGKSAADSDGDGDDDGESEAGSTSECKHLFVLSQGVERLRTATSQFDAAELKAMFDFFNHENEEKVIPVPFASLGLKSIDDDLEAKIGEIGAEVFKSRLLDAASTSLREGLELAVGELMEDGGEGLEEEFLEEGEEEEVSDPSSEEDEMLEMEEEEEELDQAPKRRRVA